jgi:glutamate synthase (ferredoxin)
MLVSLERARQSGLSGEDAVMEAFIENKNDMARVSGN